MSSSLTEEEQKQIMLYTLDNPSPAPSDILSDIEDPKDMDYTVHRSSPMMIDDTGSNVTTTSSSTTSTISTTTTITRSTSSSATQRKRFLELYDCSTIRSSKGTSVIIVKDVKQKFHKWLVVRGRVFEHMSVRAAQESWTAFVKLYNEDRVDSIISKQEVYNVKYRSRSASQTVTCQCQPDISGQVRCSCRASYNYDYYNYRPSKKRSINYVDVHNQHKIRDILDQ